MEQMTPTAEAGAFSPALRTGGNGSAGSTSTRSGGGLGLRPLRRHENRASNAPCGTRFC
jgi:hypothetical protein